MFLLDNLFAIRISCQKQTSNNVDAIGGGFGQITIKTKSTIVEMGRDLPKRG